MNFSDIIHELLSSQEPCALCTVVAISGSTPRKAGAKMIVKDNGSNTGALVGTIGGGAFEHHIRSLALKAIQENAPRLVKTSLRNELGMCCGGEMTVFIEPLQKQPRFICFGAGHISQNLCPLAHRLGFSVSVLDQRKELLELQAFDIATDRTNDTSIFAIEKLNLSLDDYVVVATHDHQLDQRIVEDVLNYPIKYLGLVGSERKALMTAKRLEAKNFSHDQIAQVICPAGLTIKAQTPQEIALSILAQITLVKNDNPKNNKPDYRSRPEHAHGLSQSSAPYQW